MGSAHTGSNPVVVDFFCQIALRRTNTRERGLKGYMGLLQIHRRCGFFLRRWQHGCAARFRRRKISAGGYRGRRCRRPFMRPLRLGRGWWQGRRRRHIFSIHICIALRLVFVDRLAGLSRACVDRLLFLSCLGHLCALLHGRRQRHGHRHNVPQEVKVLILLCGFGCVSERKHVPMSS